jgi:hypothetical protein
MRRHHLTLSLSIYISQRSLDVAVQRNVEATITKRAPKSIQTEISSFSRKSLEKLVGDPGWQDCKDGTH